MYNHFLDLQALVILIMSSKGASTDTFWWETCTLYIPSRGLCHHSFTSSAFEGRILVDLSRDRPWKDLAEVMRITLPYFREMKARLDTLSINVGYSSDSASILGPSNLANLITCLDIAESVAKMVPVFGDVLEGVCGILRKTVEAAEVNTLPYCTHCCRIDVLLEGSRCARRMPGSSRAYSFYNACDPERDRTCVYAQWW